MLTTVDNAHRSGKYSQLWIMLTDLENTHVCKKMLTTVDNAHTSEKCSQVWKCSHLSQVWKMLTSLGSAYLYTECKHIAFGH